MIPTKEQREEWRKLAENTTMISAVGEYTPEEFTILLDAVDEQELIIQKLCDIVIEIIGDELFTYLGIQDILVHGYDCNEAIDLIKNIKRKYNKPMHQNCR